MRMLAMLFAFSLVLLTGCNTIEGMGKDIERGGEKLQDSAERTQQKM